MADVASRITPIVYLRIRRLTAKRVTRLPRPGTRVGFMVSNSSCDMRLLNYRTWATVLYRKITGRIARRIYLALFLLPVLFAMGVRIRSVVLTRKIHAVLSGLEQLRVDQTTERQLLQTVPYLARYPYDLRDGASVERFYRVEISNEHERRWLWWLASTPPFRFLWSQRPAEGPIHNPAETLPLPLKTAYWLGCRYIGFSAQVNVRDGRVSRVGYGIEPDVELGWPRFSFVSAHSFHGLWIHRYPPVPVSSTDDESPEFRVIGGGRFLDAAYAADAPRELIAHAFHVDLSCYYWGIRGCVSAPEMAPLLWRDRQAIEASTASRLHSAGNQCPDRVLAGRVRYLPDLNVELREVTSARHEPASEKGKIGEAFTIHYRPKEVIRGRSYGSGTDIEDRWFIPAGSDSTENVANPFLPLLKPGDRVLVFTGAKFESCQIVPATPSAVSAVRAEVPAPKRREDEVNVGGRM
ncbi:MAG: hypothetical protein ACLQGV_15185 [Bryobacteraceae bacterium]